MIFCIDYYESLLEVNQANVSLVVLKSEVQCVMNATKKELGNDSVLREVNERHIPGKRNISDILTREAPFDLGSVCQANRSMWPKMQAKEVTFNKENVKKFKSIKITHLKRDTRYGAALSVGGKPHKFTKTDSEYMFQTCVFLEKYSDLF